MEDFAKNQGDLALKSRPKRPEKEAFPANAKVRPSPEEDPDDLEDLALVVDTLARSPGSRPRSLRKPTEDRTGRDSSP